MLVQHILDLLLLQRIMFRVSLNINVAGALYIVNNIGVLIVRWLNDQLLLSLKEMLNKNVFNCLRKLNSEVEDLTARGKLFQA